MSSFPRIDYYQTQLSCIDLERVNFLYCAFRFCKFDPPLNMVAVTAERDEEELRKVQTLGSVTLHRQGTKEVILIPTPSDDPNDPLNW